MDKTMTGGPSTESESVQHTKPGNPSVLKECQVLIHSGATHSLSTLMGHQPENGCDSVHLGTQLPRNE